jgi:UDP-N-acetylglucosamine 4,6-dehydratase
VIDAAVQCVMGSCGSVIPYFQRLRREGSSLPVTNKRMTRFWITLSQAVEFVVTSFNSMRGGELFVPRIPSMKIADLAEAIAPGWPVYEIGMRQGEKLHEEMIGLADGHRTLELKDRLTVLPTVGETDYQPSANVRPVGGTSATGRTPIPAGSRPKSCAAY